MIRPLMPSSDLDSRASPTGNISNCPTLKINLDFHSESQIQAGSRIEVSKPFFALHASVAKAGVTPLDRWPAGGLTCLSKLGN